MDNDKPVSLFELFLIFVKIGAILLGGGYVILPIITSELSQKRNLINEEDIVNYFALSQSLPGIIAANISMFAGYKLRGTIGAVAAFLGVIFVPFLSIIVLASVLDKIINNAYIQGALWGVGIALIALLLLSVREIWQKSDRDITFYVILTLALSGLINLKMSPIQVIIICSLIGVIIKIITRRRTL